MELNVALNKAKDDDFDFGVKNVLMKPVRRGNDHIAVNPGF
jgi:hypothetical protein